MHPIDEGDALPAEGLRRWTAPQGRDITARKAGKAPLDYMIFKFYDILISSVSHSAASGSPDAEAVSLSFAKDELEYRTQKADGSLQAVPPSKYDILTEKIG